MNLNLAKKIPGEMTDQELEDLINLSEKEIIEWQDFRETLLNEKFERSLKKAI